MLKMINDDDGDADDIYLIMMFGDVFIENDDDDNNY